MGLFESLTRWLTSGRPDRPAVPAMPTPMKAKSIATLPVAARSTTLQEPNGVTLTVTFTRADTGEILHAPLKLRGLTGRPAAVPWLQLRGYVLSGIEDYRLTFPRRSATIQYKYLPTMAGPVLILHRQANGPLLVPPDLRQGALGAPFTARALPDYMTTLIGPKTRSGAFTVATQTITFYYDITGEETAPTSLMYVQLTKAQQPLMQPIHGRPLPYTVPTGSFWRVYGLWRRDDAIWLDLGGGAWINGATTVPLTNGGLLEAPEEPATAKLQMSYHMKPAEVFAHIRAGGDGVTAWTKPYGRPLPDRLPDRTKVLITHFVTAADGSRWVRLDDAQFILADFIGA